MDLESLPANRARYEDVFLTGYSKIAEKDAVYRHVSHHFENSVLGSLQKVFTPEEQFNMLGVGVGAGKHEIAFMKTLMAFYRKISNTAVEPSSSLLHTYEENLQSAGITPQVDVKYINCTLRQYLDGRGDKEEKFQLISGIHCMYYLGKIEDSMDQLLSTLTENGILLLQFNSEQSAFAKLRKGLPALYRQDGPIHVEIDDVTREAKRRGCDVIKIPLQLTIDVTELFDETSDFGNKILDFFTMTSYFRQTAPKALVEEVLEFWRDNSSRDDSGRFRANAEEYLALPYAGPLL
ncbi:histamine N-methyltransferase-like [Diadema antillarum]|uniref:histamine N-methyltransferase-like n=1 Tax=Diadema antillarum TaxID=105358 RepID=UPI003A89E973